MPKQSSLVYLLFDEIYYKNDLKRIKGIFNETGQSIDQDGTRLGLMVLEAIVKDIMKISVRSIAIYGTIGAIISTLQSGDISEGYSTGLQTGLIIDVLQYSLRLAIETYRHFRN